MAVLLLAKFGQNGHAIPRQFHNPVGIKNLKRPTIIMKKYFRRVTQTVLGLGSAGLVFGAASAQAQRSGFYLDGDVGVNLADDLVSNDGLGSVALNPGVRGDLAVGYGFGILNHVSLGPELEAGVIYNSFGDGSANGHSSSGGGDLVQVPVLVNLVLGCRVWDRWSVYGGFGVGIEYSDATVSSGSPLSGLSGRMGGLAWQAKLGVQYKLGPGDINLDYKFLDYGGIYLNNLGNSAIEASYTLHF